MKKISIVSPCYNEEQNVELLYEKVKQQFAVNLKNYEYEHIFIDNFSDDETPSILRKIASKDKNVKVIFNSRNFGHIRSPFYGLLQATGDATMLLVSDLQDPPELIPEFVSRGIRSSLVLKTNQKNRVCSFLFEDYIINCWIVCRKYG